MAKQPIKPTLNQRDLAEYRKGMQALTKLGNHTVTHVYVLTCNTYGDTYNRGVFSSEQLATEALRIERKEHPECFYEIEQFILDTPGQVFDGDTAQTV